MSRQYDAPRSRLARSVVQYLSQSESYPYATLVGVQRKGTHDVLDIELELELNQRRQVPICSREPISIVFMANDDSWSPRVRSERDGFPVGMVHTNLDPDVDGGVCLCIWEESWSDLATNLTGQILIERIRAWFSSMAAGTIHDVDQRLEPLIHTGSNTLIIPPGRVQGPWHVQLVSEHAGRLAVAMGPKPPEKEVFGNNFALYNPRMPSQIHRGLALTPYDLGALHQLCIELGFDLIKDLSSWLKDSVQLANASQRLPMLILTVPKRRFDDAEDEEVEVWCYSFGHTLAELGERLNITATEAGATTITVLGSPNGVDLAAIRLEPWRVVPRLDRAAARRFSGVSRGADTRLLGIGAGAIGSNVAMIATRSGLGTWTIVDGDILLPHNTVRQVQRNGTVGFGKAEVLRHELDNVLAETGNAFIAVDVFNPAGEAQALDSALRSAEVAVDFSASPAVLSWLSEQPVNRAVSAFFGPSGSDLVVLAEGSSRDVRIDEIEAQYFWAVAVNEELKDHLAAARMDRIRYANACQDLSRPLPPWQVHTLCGLAAGRLAQIIEEADASFRVWRLETGSGAVDSVCVPVQPVRRFHTGEMRVTISDEVVRTMRELRRQSGRNETGGVLLGTFDLVRNVLHVVAALTAPSDSKQAPTYFVRGMKDLKPRIERLAEASAGRLHYIGEWHSHPGGVPARPSNDDEQVYAHLKSHMGPAGTPYVMAICGDRESWLRAGWQERGDLEGVVTHGYE
ncbi:Mov34/MPN/PAD-1 family protein [Pseudomonas svalbardensis]|uniref:Mov34/MPN/PAD-1 family protein n=1 Tax=Pseudomonas svalbardensis TaxID=3042029 RepID=UPI0024B396A4|nr:Mov34/MPN/PAD-1 family protein [Pseudomonas sp. PMCC200367]